MNSLHTSQETYLKIDTITKLAGEVKRSEDGEKGSWDFAVLGTFDSQFLAHQYLNIIYTWLRIRLGEIRHTEALRKIRGVYKAQG